MKCIHRLKCSIDKMTLTWARQVLVKIAIYLLVYVFLLLGLHFLMSIIISQVTWSEYFDALFQGSGTPTTTLYESKFQYLSRFDYLEIIFFNNNRNIRERILDVSVIVGVTTVWMTFLTMMQQHRTRKQDRALNFPELKAKECEFILDDLLIQTKARSVFESSAKMMIILRFEKAFPRYYSPFVRRIWVVRKNRNYTLKSKKLEILNCGSSMSVSKDKGFCIELAFSDLDDIIKKFCERTNRKTDGTLHLVIDIEWKNNLLLANSVYIRETIVLKGVKKPKSGYVYKIVTINLSRAPLLSCE